MRVVSLFAGIGGFDLGFTQAGHTIVAHVERDKHCQKLLAAKWPNAVALDDVCTAGRHNLPDCDLITFGFPCQDLSVAGKRAGLTGKRSGLFYEATRIIRELQPDWALFENVPGLFSSGNGADFAAVLAEMADCGYSGAWRVLDAQWFGVAQRRRRVFGLFTRLDSGAERCAEILSIENSLRGYPSPSRETRENIAGTIGGSSQSGGFRTTDLDNNGAFVPETGRGTPLIPEIAMPLMSERHGSSTGPQTQFIPEIAGCINSGAHPGGFNGQDAHQPGHLIPVAFERRFVRTTGGQPTIGPHPCLRSSTGDGAPCVAYNYQVRRLTPRECERLQGFPDDWTAGFSDSARYRMLGNAVAVPVARWIAERMKI